MKSFRITSSCLFHGSHIEAGTVLSQIDAKDAADLLAAGRAIEVIEVIEHRAPQIEHRDPKPARSVKAR